MRWSSDIVRAFLVAAIVLGAGCSKTAGTDSGPPEGGVADRGADALRPDLAADHRAADRSTDHTRQPPHWSTVAGASLKVEGHSVTALAGGDLLVVGGMWLEELYTYTYLAKAYRYQAASGTLVEAGQLAHARMGHSATRLADGRVLVVGGADSSIYRQDSELYDPTKPADQAWSAGPPLSEVRRHHAALLLSTNELMLSGGANNSGALDSVLLLKPGATTWTFVPTPLKAKRHAHCATELAGGKVLISGGRDGTVNTWTDLASLELWDPKSGSSAALAVAMSSARAFHSATRLDDGRVLLVGGICGIVCGSSRVDELYDPLTSSLTPLTHPGTYPSTHLAVRLLDGRVLITGNDEAPGHMVLAFTASPPGWDILPQPTQPRYAAEGAVLPDGSVLLVGGMLSSTPFEYADSLERLFP